MLMSKTKNELKILRLLAVNCQIINEMGCGLDKPLIILCACPEKAVKALKIWPQAEIVMNPNEKALKKALQKVNSDFVFIFVRPSLAREVVENVDLLLKCGYIGEERMHAVPVILLEKMPDLSDFPEAFIVYLDERIDNMSRSGLELKDIVPDERQLSLVEEEFGKQKRNCDSRSMSTMIAAVCCAYPILKEDTFKIWPLLQSAKRMCKLNDALWDFNGLGDAFVDSILKWQEKKKFVDVYELPVISEEVERKFWEVFLYDDDFFYIKESFLPQLCNDFFKLYPSHLLKQILILEGVLLTDASRADSVKVGMYLPSGEYKRERMLKFSRQRFSRPGELDIIDACLQTEVDSHAN